MPIDYISQLIGYSPIFAAVTGFAFCIKFSSKYFTEKLKHKKTEEKVSNKPKGIFDTIIEGIEQAPRAKQLLDNELAHLMKTGASEEQMKSLKSKKQFVDLMANEYVQMLGMPAVGFVKENLKGFVKI